MNNEYIKQPPDVPAMTAEEFVASLEGTCQDQAGSECECERECTYTCPPRPVCPPRSVCPPAATCPPMSACPPECCPPESECKCVPQVVCCQLIPAPQPAVPPVVDEGCCCKRSFRAALQLLCDQEVSGYLDFTRSAFITDSFIGGTTLVSIANTEAVTYDNLADALTGTFRRFSPCSSDLLDISAPLYYPVEGALVALPFPAAQVSLCELSALVIQQAAVSAEGELSAEDVAARNFRRLKWRMSTMLGESCGQRHCCCDARECCCAEGVLSSLADSNLSRRVTLTAGWLALYNAELLGSAGNVLVLANDLDQRLYFVCVTKVQFLG